MVKIEKISAIFLTLFAIVITSGCATTQTTADNPDQLEPANRVSYNFTDSLDKNFIKPIAETYVEVTPEVARSGITNFFNNLSYLNVILNSFLQGKFDQGLSGMTRFIFNSTIGLGGLVDIGSHVGLPAHEEDFGQTLAAWGVGQGSYLYVPVQGPNTARNLPDTATSILLNPLTYVTGAVLWPLTAINLINTRANALDATNLRDEAALDPYAFTREAYLQQRQYLIYDGDPPIEGYDDIFDTEASGDTDDESGILVIE